MAVGGGGLFNLFEIKVLLWLLLRLKSAIKAKFLNKHYSKARL